MARYISLADVKADLASIPQTLNSNGVRATWRTAPGGNVYLDVRCTEGHIPENFTTVMDRAAELCKQAGIPISLNFDRTHFGSRAELQDNIQRLRELSRPIEWQLPPPVGRPVINEQWTSEPTHNAPYSYPTSRGTDWSFLEEYGEMIAILLMVLWVIVCFGH